MKHPIVETEIEGYRAYRLESEDAQVTATSIERCQARTKTTHLS